MGLQAVHAGAEDSVVDILAASPVLDSSKHSAAYAFLTVIVVNYHIFNDHQGLTVIAEIIKGDGHGGAAQFAGSGILSH